MKDHIAKLAIQLAVVAVIGCLFGWLTKDPSLPFWYTVIAAVFIAAVEGVVFIRNRSQK